MSTQGGGPPNKTAVLDTMDFTTPADYNNAVTALEDLGFKYDHQVPNAHGNGVCVIFQNYSKQNQ